MNAKLYRCKIYEGDSSLVRDFIPYLNEKGEAGLYDLCGTGFYGNASGLGGFSTNYERPVIITRKELKSGDHKRFKYESTITFTNCGIGADMPLENIPVLLRLTPTSPAGFSVGDCAAKGEDLAFASCEDGSWLDYDIEAWDVAKCAVWVRVPKLSVKTKLKMYWGLKDGKSPGLDTSTATWTNSHYATVLHMNKIGGLDSTGSNEFTGNDVGIDEGIVGQSMRVTSMSGMIQLPSSDAAPAPWALALTSRAFTISFWLRADTTFSGWPYFVDWYNHSTDNYGFLICGAVGDTVDSGTALWQVLNIDKAACPEITKTALSTKWPASSTYRQNWLYYTVSYARVNNQVHEEHYVDGQQILMGDYDLLNPEWNIAHMDKLDNPLVLMNSLTTVGRGMDDARMDEFRISSVACGAAEAAANYRMMVQADFASFGARTKASSPVPSGLIIFLH